MSDHPSSTPPVTAENVVNGMRHAVKCPYLSTPRGGCDCNPLDDSKAMTAADVLRIFSPLPPEEAEALRKYMRTRGDDQ